MLTSTGTKHPQHQIEDLEWLTFAPFKGEVTDDLGDQKVTNGITWEVISSTKLTYSLWSA